MARINPNMMMIDGGYEPLVTVIAQAVAASPVVVNTPANVAPSTTEALKVAEKVAAAVAPIIAPDVSDSKLSQIAKQTTTAVVTNPAVIAAPTGQTVNTTTLQGIVEASVKMPYDSTKPATTVTMPYAGTTTPSVKNLDTASQSTEDTGMIEAIPLNYKGGNNATPRTDANLTDKELALASLQAARELAMTPYTELTPAERAAMSQKEKMNYLQAAREEQDRLDAEERGINDPMKNPNIRPDAPAADANYIYYYSWIGGSTTGSWQPYRAPNNAENQAKYGARSVGGETQATTEGVTGANTLTVQPEPVKDDKGTITGWSVPNTTATTETGITPNKVVTTPIAPVTPTSTPITTSVTTPVTTPVSTPTTTTTDPNAALIKQLQDQIATLQKTVTDKTTADQTTAAAQRASTIAVLQDRFQKYGLTSLASKIKELAIDGATEATITLQLQETPEYQMRFAANADRLKKGLTVLSPAEYLNAEDEYRQKLRDYGLKQFDTDAYVRQFISNDTSLTEISNRIVTAVQRVQNADPAVMKQLRDYYGITQESLVGYVLDPEQQFEKIKLQVSSAEIGVEAKKQGLDSNLAVSEQLAKQGITQAEAQKGYSTIADILPSAEKLSAIYGGRLDSYEQSEGEQEVFNSLASAQRKRQKLSAAEIAQFSGSSGLSKTSLLDQAKGQF